MEGTRYLTDLEQKDFKVFEDGNEQDVTFFNKTNLPVALALLLDTSASMENKLPTAQEAAVGFARRLRPQDLAEVVDFDSRVTVLQSFTPNAAELETAIRRTAAASSPISATSTARFPTSCPASTPWATRRRTPSVMAPGGGSSSASTGRISRREPSKGISRPPRTK